MTTSSKTADKPLRSLADGNHIPVLGLGVWQVPIGVTTVNAVRWALELDYRHIDTAQAYGFGASEGVLADALSARARREEVIVATKGGLRKDGDDLHRDASAKWLREGVEFFKFLRLRSAGA